LKKPILITLLCASLMLVTPLTGVAQENKIRDSIPDIPDDVYKLGAKIKDVVNEILVKYVDIPTVRSICNVILNITDAIGRIIYCIILAFLIIPIGILAIFFGLVLRNEYIGYYLAVLVWVIVGEINSVCYWYFNPPFQSIYTMLNVNNNIQSFDDCPCLQE